MTIPGLAARPDGDRLARPAKAPRRSQTASARNLPWVSLAIVFVVGGALAVGLLVQSAGDRTAVLAARRAIPPGRTITMQDLRIVEVGLDGGASLVRATARDSIIGKVAVVGIPAGALLAPGQVAADGGLAPGSVVVGALLGPGELPVSTLRPGDSLRLVGVSSGSTGDLEPLGQASVFSSSPIMQSGSVFVSLVVDDTIADQVVDVAAQKRLRLVLLPAGSETDR